MNRVPTEIPTTMNGHAPTLLAPAPAAPAPPPGAHPALRGRRLGEILVETAGLSPERLEEALALQRGEGAGARLGELLVRLKAATEEQVLRALAAQLDVPFLARIDPESVPAELVKKVPINFAKSARVLPLGGGTAACAWRWRTRSTPPPRTRSRCSSARRCSPRWPRPRW